MEELIKKHLGINTPQWIIDNCKALLTEWDSKKVDTSEGQLTIPDVVQQSEQFICPDCKKPEKEYRDGLCEMCHKWHTS